MHLPDGAANRAELHAASSLDEVAGVAVAIFFLPSTAFKVIDRQKSQLFFLNLSLFCYLAFCVQDDPSQKSQL